jgi:4-phytase/acid phosphatase
MFDLAVRPPYLAARTVGPVALTMVDALESTGTLKIYVVSGHDTNVSALGGILGLHWTTPGFAPDDPPPGGGLLFELVSNRAGERFVRAFWVSQGADQIRSLSAAPPHVEAKPIPGCTPSPTRCSLASFSAMIRARSVALH